MEIIITVFFCIIIYVSQQTIYHKYWDKKLKVEIKFMEQYVEAGDKAEITEVVNNAKLLPLPAFHVKFSTSKTFLFSENDNSRVTDLYHRNDAFSIMGNQKVTRRLNFTTTKRGMYFITGTNIIARDFFLVKAFAKALPDTDYIYVLPRKKRTPELQALYNAVIGEIETKSGLYEDPFSFRGIREYTTSDSMRSINWKATAKTDELMVNVYNNTCEERIRILLNLEMNAMIKIEYVTELCIELASTLSAEFIHCGIPVSLETNGLDVLTGELVGVESGASAEHIITVDKHLARIKANGGIAPFLSILQNEHHKADKNTTYIIVSAYHKQDLLELVDQMVMDGLSVAMLCPYLDLQGLENHRDYIYGMEVPVNEV